ncbi:MAG: hypothetical protein SO183_10140 [Fusobacterium mortiferum]|nr:hypothetical protein [Fusobacterium mortiferum]
MKFNFLTKEFFDKYKECLELEKKENRPYACTTLINCLGMTFAVPLRSNIQHEYALFTNKEKTKGLDLSKAVVINDYEKFVDTVTKVYISDDEYKVLLGKENFLSKKLETYIKKYKKALKNPDIPKNSILLKYSTLQHFHKELNIEEIQNEE